jgi:hypothetical protein
MLARDQKRSHRRGLLLVGVVGLASLSLTSAATSLALFTDTQTKNATFSSGSVALDAAKINGLSLSAGDMAPGDRVTDRVVVENDGTLALRYAITADSTDDSSPNGGPLYGVLDLKVKTHDTTTPDTPCDDFDGYPLYNGGLGASTDVVGDRSAGQQSGDRTLAPGESETLCFRVELPSSVGNAYQNAAATTTFSFVAEQTANNP